LLKELCIHNIAIIKDECVCPGNALTVLTGETGAGKSIIIDSINLLLGAKADKELIRQ
jgi:DNA repair protein RecN (Recombination protein N)